MGSHSHAQQEAARIAKKALAFLAEFSSFSDNKPSVHIDRVNKALSGADIEKLVKWGGMEGLPNQRGGSAITRTFNVETLEALSGTTLQAVRDEVHGRSA